MSEKVDMRALLEVAKCPCCDGSGGRYDNYGNAEQCQWCYERSVAIAAPAPVATTVCSACRGSGKELHVYGPATLCRDCRPDAALVEALRNMLSDDDIRHLRRFQEICEDSDADGHDLPKEAVRRLERAGALRSCGFGRHETTLFGDAILAALAGKGGTA